MINKLVSVVVTTKNNTATLADCLESIVKKQTYPRIELVVVDNFSTDDTIEIARRYTDQVFQKGPERSTQRNYAVEKAHGAYVAIIDSDMVLAPEVIEQCVQAMQEPDVTGVVIPEESFGEGFWAACKKLERSFYVGVSYMEAARFFDKKTYLAVGGYDTDMVSGEDWDLSQRVEAKGKLSRCQAFIYHNEGRISLSKTVGKKFYYAKKFSAYQAKSTNRAKTSSQTSVIGRYGLFLRQPGKLFKNPILGLGVLYMKTCEFGFGAAGLIAAKLHWG